VGYHEPHPTPVILSGVEGSAVAFLTIVKPPPIEKSRITVIPNNISIPALVQIISAQSLDLSCAKKPSKSLKITRLFSIICEQILCLQDFTAQATA
jgi:hypothetical protein